MTKRASLCGRPKAHELSGICHQACITASLIGQSCEPYGSNDGRKVCKWKPVGGGWASVQAGQPCVQEATGRAGGGGDDGEQDDDRELHGC